MVVNASVIHIDKTGTLVLIRTQAQARGQPGRITNDQSPRRSIVSIANIDSEFQWCKVPYTTFLLTTSDSILFLPHLAWKSHCCHSFEGIASKMTFRALRSQVASTSITVRWHGSQLTHLNRYEHVCVNWIANKPWIQNHWHSILIVTDLRWPSSAIMIRRPNLR